MDGEHLRYLETALRALLPVDFPPSVPVYPVSRWDAGPEFRFLRRGCGDDALAWTSPVLDIALQNHLESTGRWKGRGFAFIVQEEFAPQGVDLIHTALHESSHWLSYPIERTEPQRSSESTNVEFDVPREMKRTQLLNLIDEHAGKPWPPWVSHGADFFRAAWHVIVRARARGFSCDPETLCFGYGLADPFAYLLALDGEPERRSAMRSSRRRSAAAVRRIRGAGPSAQRAVVVGNRAGNDAPRAGAATRDRAGGRVGRLSPATQRYGTDSARAGTSR